MARIQLKSLRKHYDDVEAVRDVNLDIEHNEFVVLVGPSGCGKSTTLRMIAGLEEVTSGDIWLGDALVNDLPPRDRDIAMVFQSYALYPHMSVFKNMSFGLEMRKMPKDEIDARVKEAAEILDITDLLGRRPRQLSGGERQRVAMGRAIVRKPQVFLFDEPLSNLDAKLRVQMRTEIKLIHGRVQTTVVYVTHDQVEAMTLADRIVVMNSGRIEQVATPQEMYDSPATRFVAGFIGSPAMNFIPCALESNADGASVTLGKALSLPVPEERRERYSAYTGKEMVFGIRPEHITERRAHTEAAQHDFEEEVVVLEPTGMDTMVFMKLNEVDVCARSVPRAAGEVGKSMGFTINMDHMHLVDPGTDRVV